MPREGTETFITVCSNTNYHEHLEIRCPERGRKLYFLRFNYKLCLYLEIRCPERGRKRSRNFSSDIPYSSSFGNKMPREGTETNFFILFPPFSLFHLEIRCPERGRKLDFKLLKYSHVSSIFGNKMPREGTETISMSPSITFLTNLEIRCPERGRKQIVISISYVSCYTIWK